MINILKGQIECAIVNMVRYTSNFQEAYVHYVVETAKPDNTYDKKLGDSLFIRADNYANLAIKFAKEMELDAEAVCPDCISFVQSYKDKRSIMGLVNKWND